MKCGAKVGEMGIFAVKFAANLFKKMTTTVFSMPLQKLTSKSIRELQAQFPNATVQIETHQPAAAGQMDENVFWEILEKLDWKNESEDDILQPAVVALSKFSGEAIFKFHDILAEKLYALDGQKFAEQLGSNKYSKVGDHPFSVDSFLYSRCCVVASGQKFFEKVLKNHAAMPKEFTFESLLYLPENAFDLKTGGEEYDHEPEIWYETFSNSSGWPGMISPKELILMP